MTNEIDDTTHDFIEIKEQGPDKDFEGVEDQAKSDAWVADWYGPEEKIEDEKELAEYGIEISFRNGPKMSWWYPEIRTAMDTKTVKEFVISKGIVNATQNDIEELEAFFFHYVRFMLFDIEVPDQHGPNEWEVEDVIETIGDDILDEMEKEYTTLGKTLDKDDVKRTLH